MRSSRIFRSSSLLLFLRLLWTLLIDVWSFASASSYDLMRNLSWGLPLRSLLYLKYSTTMGSSGRRLYILLDMDSTSVRSCAVNEIFLIIVFEGWMHVRCYFCSKIIFFIFCLFYSPVFSTFCCCLSLISMNIGNIDHQLFSISNLSMRWCFLSILIILLHSLLNWQW